LNSIGSRRSAKEGASNLSDDSEDTADNIFLTSLSNYALQYSLGPGGRRCATAISGSLERAACLLTVSWRNIALTLIVGLSEIGLMSTHIRISVRLCLGNCF
jgi:hypothetical protein